MSFHRRRFLHLTAGAAALPAVTHLASAQAYPSRPITMNVLLKFSGFTENNFYFTFRQTTVTTAILPFAEKGAGCVL